MNTKQSPLQIVVTDSRTNETIGRMTPREFMVWATWQGASDREFLQTIVQKFNDWKASIGEPERVTVELRKGRR